MNQNLLRKKTPGIITAPLLMTVFSTQLKASTDTKIIATMETETIESAKTDALPIRLYEINTMGKSQMTPQERLNFGLK